MDVILNKFVEPKPKDFGITEDRIKILENPPCDYDLNKSPLFWSIFIFVVLVATIYLYNNSRLNFVTFLVIIWFSLIGASFPIYFFFELTDEKSKIPERWRSKQPDYLAFQQYQETKRIYQNKLETWLRTQERWWQSLDGKRFELEIAELFRERGYIVQHTGKRGDEGVDLVFIKNENKILVQCKAHKNPVNPSIVRDLYGALTAHGDKEAWVISTSVFTTGAKKFARGKSIRLVTIRDILKEKLDIR